MLAANPVRVHVYRQFGAHIGSHCPPGAARTLSKPEYGLVLAKCSSASSPSFDNSERYGKLIPRVDQDATRDSELLWAGYSDLSEQLKQAKRSHEALQQKLHDVTVKLQSSQQRPPVPAWQAASFLLFFWCFINVVGWMLNFQVALPTAGFWAKAPPPPQSSLWLKELVNMVRPFTNTAVVLIFCVQAIRAAWVCLTQA